MYRLLQKTYSCGRGGDLGLGFPVLEEYQYPGIPGQIRILPGIPGFPVSGYICTKSY